MKSLFLKTISTGSSSVRAECPQANP
jgi:hypothetical protein